MRSTLPLLSALLLAACSRDARPTTPAPSVRIETCALADGRLAFGIPLEDTDALAVAPDGCLFVDESAGVRVLSLASLATDEEGAELLDRDAEAFFRQSGLLGESPEPIGRGTLEIGGHVVPGVTWQATLPELGGPLHVTTGAYRQGGDWLLLLLMHAPGDDEGGRRLLRLAAELAAPPAR